MWVVLGLALGCGARTNEAASTTPTDSPAATPADDARTRMIRALSTRDAGPTCADLEAMSASPVADLTAIVETVSMPPMVPMRAADCLVSRHAAEAEATLAKWVVDPNTKGLAMLVTDRVGAIPEDVAVRLATGALAGPHAAAVKGAIEAAPQPAVRALVAGVAP